MQASGRTSGFVPKRQRQQEKKDSKSCPFFHGDPASAKIEFFYTNFYTLTVSVTTQLKYFFIKATSNKICPFLVAVIA
jgi:hypothetical protein